MAALLFYIALHTYPYFKIEQAYSNFLRTPSLNTKRQQITKSAAFFSSKPADGVFKQNRISSVFERLFSFNLLYLIRKAEHDFYATLPSLWISFHEILRSGLSDVWASCVALLLCYLTPYLWPFSLRPGRWKF